MSNPTPFTPNDVPEADYLDQNLPVEDTDSPSADGDLFPIGIPTPWDVDDADRLDQARTIALEEDTHRHDSDSTPY